MPYAIDSRRIAKNTVALYIRLGVSMIVSFIAARVTLQQLGVEDYGLNNLVASVVSLFSFVNAALGTAVQRFYSIEIGKRDDERLRRVFGAGLFLHLVVAVVTLVMGELFALFFLQRMNIPIERMFAARVVYQISLLQLLLVVVTVPYAALLRAREMFSQTAVVEIIQSLLRLVILYLLVHISYDKLITLSLLNLSITVVYVVSLTVLARRFEEARQGPLLDSELIRQMLSFISMLVVTVLALLLKTQGIVVLINLFFGLVINAAWAVVVQVSNLVNTFVASFKQSMDPQLMAAYGAGDLRAMHKIINTGTKIGFLLVAAISFPFIFESQFILDLWLKTPPKHSAELVSLMLVSVNISAFTYFHYQGVHASGRILGQQIWVSATYLVNLVVVWILFKLGAGFNTALFVEMVIGVVQCWVNVHYARKCYDYDVGRFVKGILLPCLAVTAFVVAAMFALTLSIEPSTMRFVVVFSVSTFMICILGWFLLFDSSERKQLKQMRVSIINRHNGN